MRTYSQSWSLVGILASLSTAVAYDLHGAYFVLNHGPPLVTERLDPVISPGQNPSNHVHNVFGANTFAPTFDFAASQKATCNTHGVKPDMSNYWYPALYFKDKSTGTYKIVPTQLETYYHYDPMNGKSRTAFPAGFKMLSGNAMLRHNDSSTNVNTASIKWNCHGPDNVITEGGFGTGFTTCPSYPGYSAEIWFPFCWDGSMDFDPSNPAAHIVFGQGNDGTPTQQGGDCPSSHPTPLPQIFAEFHHDMSGFTWGADEQPFTLAQGDPLGFGMHMDFVSGWDVATLQAAIDTTDGTTTKCRVGESGDPLSDCFEMLDQSVVSSCTIPSVVEGDGDVSNPGSSLPGCNPPQTGPQDATIQTTCAGYKAPTVQTSAAGGPSSAAAPAGSSPAAAASATGNSAPAATQGSMPATTGTPPTEKEADPSASNAPAPSSAPPSPAESGPASSSNSGDDAVPSTVEVSGSSWSYQGCYSDLTPDRSIRTLPVNGPVNSGKNADSCAAACAAEGYKIAGIEFGWQCFCGNSLNTSQAKKIADSECNMPCAGSTEACGGNGALQVYAAKGVSLSKRSPHIHRHIRDFGVRESN